MAFAEGKSDMERLGIFKEMGYISIGDKYSPPNNNRPFNEPAHRSRQMQAGFASQRCALQNGFFEKTYSRIFEREALNDPIKLARQYRNQQAKRILGKTFLPSNAIKKPCGSGSYYGTLSGPMEAMSPQTLPRKPHKSPGRNVMTSPGKKGSGYSYPNVTLSGTGLYASDPYDRAKEYIKKEALSHRSKVKAGPFRLNLHPKDFFQDNPYRGNKPASQAHRTLPSLVKKVGPAPFKPSSPSKRIGGMKAGTFDSYPTHSADPYTTRRSKSTHQRPVFHPAPGPKSTPVKSIIMHNVNRSVHSANYTSTIPAVMSL